MIMRNNSITYSHFKLLCINWVPRKLLVIPIHADNFMLHIFYLLGVINKVVNLAFSCRLLFFVSLVLSNDIKKLAFF